MKHNMPGYIRVLMATINSPALCMQKTTAPTNYLKELERESEDRLSMKIDLVVKAVIVEEDERNSELLNL